MTQSAALIALAEKRAARGGNAYACMPGMSFAPGAGTTVLELVDQVHPARASLERFIAACFLRSYGALISHFADTLLGLRGADGEWLAALGYSLPAHRETFIEQYLDAPLERAVAEALGERVERAAVAEVGNMAATSPGMGRLLIALATRHLHDTGFEFVVFTATRALSNSFARLGLRPFPVAPADPARLRDGDGNWGSYYHHNPVVMAGRIANGLPKLDEEAA
ncbi:MAG TPA: thermostable hemolysin [Methyloversatilis sp.]